MSDLVGVAARGQAVLRILAHRFEHSESRGTIDSLRHEQRLGDEIVEQIHHVIAVDQVAISAHRRRGARSNPPANTASRSNNTRSGSSRVS